MDDLNLPRGYSLVDVTPQREELSLPQGYALQEENNQPKMGSTDPFGEMDRIDQDKPVYSGDFGTVSPEQYQTLEAERKKKEAGPQETDNSVGFNNKMYVPWRDEPVEKPFLLKTADDIAGGVYQGFWELAQKGAALTDAIKGGDELTTTFENNIPQYDPHNELISDVAGIVGGIGGGIKAVNEVGKALGKLPSLWSKFMAANVAPALTMDSDSETMITGDDAEITKLINGFETNGNRSEQVLAGAANQIIDAFVAAGLVDRGLGAVAGAAKILNDSIIQPLRVGNMGNMEKAIMKDTLEGLTGVVSAVDPKEKAARMQELVDALNRAKGEKLSADQAGIPNIDISRDSLSAIEMGTSDDFIKTRAAGLRSGMEAKGATQLRNKLALPGKQADAHLNLLKEQAGGDAAVQMAGEGYQNKALAEYKTYTDTVDATRKKIDASEKGIQTLLKKDPTFEEQIKRATNAAGLDFHGLKTDAANSITDVLDEASQVMTKKKNDLYDAIPNNAPIDLPSYNAAKAKADKFLSPEAKAELDGIFKPSTENFNEGMAMTNESGAPSGANFRALDEFASSTLADEISAAKSAGLFDKARELQNFKRHLQSEQLDMLANSSDAAMAGPAKAAKKYYTEEYAPIWRDGPLEDIQNTFRSKGKIKPNEARTESRETLSSQIMDNPDRPEYQDQLLKVLESPEGKKSSGKVVDYILGDVSREIVPKLNIAGKLTTDEIVGLTNKFAQFGGILKRVNPTEFKRFDDFFTKLRDKNISTKELQAELKSLEAGLPKAEVDIFGGMRSKFFRDKEPLQNTKPAFKEVFNSPNAVQDTQKLLDEGVNPKGVEASFIENLSNFTMNNKKAKTLSTDQQVQYEELKKTADKLFNKRPATADMTFRILEEAQRISKADANKFPIYDVSGPRKGAGRAIDVIITQVFGPLDRWGSRFRSAAGRVLGAIDPSKSADLVLDNLMANADEFERVAQQVIDSEAKKLTKDQKNIMRRVFSLPILYADENRTEKKNLKEQTGKALQR